MPSISVGAAGLSGGSTTPTIEANTRRAYSTNLEFDPIDYRFLYTSASGINVQVTTNGIPAVCTGNCAYAFQTYSEVTALSLTGSTIALTITDPTSIGFATSTVSVSVGGQTCTEVGGSTLAAYSCTLPTNTDSTPIIVAGSVTPLVAIATYGISALSSGTAALTVALAASTLSVSTGGDNGGYLISLNGAGFPLDPSLIKIMICSKNTTVKSVNNIKADFYVPTCGSLGAQPVTVTVGAETDSSLSFTFVDGSTTAPMITQLVPASANPGIKGTL